MRWIWLNDRPGKRASKKRSTRMPLSSAVTTTFCTPWPLAGCGSLMPCPRQALPAPYRGRRVRRAQLEKIAERVADLPGALERLLLGAAVKRVHRKLVVADRVAPARLGARAQQAIDEDRAGVRGRKPVALLVIGRLRLREVGGVERRPGAGELCLDHDALVFLQPGGTARAAFPAPHATLAAAARSAHCRQIRHRRDSSRPPPRRREAHEPAACERPAARPSARAPSPPAP